jgi:hypothetical protein
VPLFAATRPCACEFSQSSGRRSGAAAGPLLADRPGLGSL